MKSKQMEMIIVLFLCMLFFNPFISAMDSSSESIDTINTLELIQSSYLSSNAKEDLDPLVDVEVTVNINEIRALDEIDKHTKPDFFVNVIINDQKFKSPIWRNQKVLKNIDWQATCDVPDDQEFVEIIIQLRDWNLGFNTKCDIAVNDNRNPKRKDITVYYSIKSGHWYGDDLISLPHSWWVDYSGYGRGNGCDDNSIYEDDYDCEIFFDISQNDFDNDGIPYWSEINEYNTDPQVDNTGLDEDLDNVPIEWEHKWGHIFDYEYDEEENQYIIVHEWMYHPFEYNDHFLLDPDGDGITNLEEYYTSAWKSDPFRKDIFVELDQMEGGPNGEPASVLPEESKELIIKAFHRQNILFHLDDGSWENSGSDMIPFDESTDGSWNTPNNELDQIYQKYFIENTEDKWRYTVFHYGVVIYQSSVVNGNAFGSNRFQISAKGVAKKARTPFPITGNMDVCFASAYMHELGHSLGLMWLGGHDSRAYYPWQPLWWKFRPYKSVMNYGYMYGSLHNLIDYSDGSRGKNDFNDWENIDYYYFLEEFN